MSLRRETYNALPCLLPRDELHPLVWYSRLPTLAHLCPRVRATHLVKFAGPEASFASLLSRRHASQGGRGREGGREVRRHRFKSQTIGKQSFSNDYPFREEGNNFWKFSFFSLENACRSWWKISVVELLTSVVLVRGEGSWSSVSVELYVASSRRTNLSFPRSFNQLTGNYREINHFCASLHEPLDDVAKSQATRLVYISSTAGGCLRFPRETRGNYSRKSKERRGCELSSSCSLPGRNSPGMRWTDSWH